MASAIAVMLGAATSTTAAVLTVTVSAAAEDLLALASMAVVLPTETALAAAKVPAAVAFLWRRLQRLSIYSAVHSGRCGICGGHGLH